ncbi:MAG TPA: VanZ family protein, partial [Anaerolineales bacterium]|nr:VanZ family protein [Anaerolineales bacterium]
LDIVPRWFPAFLMMAIIFAFSSRAKDELPNFQDWEYFVKKSSHFLVYGLLALSYIRALPKRNHLLAWALAILYALSDEFHQSFVPGRTSSLVDVFVFDNLGAIVALVLHQYLTIKNNRKETQ